MSWLGIQLSKLPLATIHDGEGWLKNPLFKTVLPQLIYSKFIISDLSFQERFKKRFGYEPILTASNAYDSINAVLAAYAEGLETMPQLRNYLLTKEHETVTFGKLKFAVDGSVPSKVKVIDYP